MRSTLIPTDELETALKDYQARNALIVKLSLSQPHDPEYLSKIILAFWLGANSAIAQQEARDKINAFTKAGYLCLLKLAKLIDLLKEKKSPRVSLVERCQKNLFNFYNASYWQFSTDPSSFFVKFSRIISAYNKKAAATVDDHSLIQKIFAACLDHCKHPEKEVINPFTLTKTEKCKEWLWGKGISRYLIERITSPPISFEWYENKINQADPNFYMATVLIPTEYNNTLTGLYILSVEPCSRLVITLWGHFQTEHLYLATEANNYYHLFKSDVLFLNHRNFSRRSISQATSIQDYANDVISCVNFFISKKEIILYGMCGGGMPMLFAAKMLREKNIPFKLILDRTFLSYNDLFGLRNTYWHLSFGTCIFFNKKIEGFSDLALAILVTVFLIAIIRILLKMETNHLDARAVIEMIPWQDVLLLQAKSHTKNNLGNPSTIDMFVHPKIDMRNADKCRRSTRKKILNEIYEESQAIIHCTPDSIPIKSIFQHFSNCFYAMLQLISDEKLISNEWFDVENNFKTRPTSTNAHDSHLFSCHTRTNTNISFFVRGFCAKPEIDLQSLLLNFRKFDWRRFQNELLCEYKDTPYKEQWVTALQKRLNHFFELMHDHANLIHIYGNRLLVMKRDDIRIPIRTLTELPLMSELALTSRKLYSV